MADAFGFVVAVSASSSPSTAAVMCCEPPAGTRLHAVAEEGIATHEIAEAMSWAFDLPVASIASDDVQDHFGWIGAY